MARRIPLTFTGWQEGEGTAFAHEALQMTAEKLHEIVVAGIIADAEKRIADLREELERLGVTTEDVPPAIAPVQPRFMVISEEADVLEPAPLPVLPKRQPVKARPIAARKKVNGSRHHV